MQDKELISDNNNQHDVSSHTQQLAECIAELGRTTSSPSAETFKQILVSLPEPYKTMGIHAMAEHFVNTMQIHLLQTIAKFYQQATDEGIDAEERDESLKDVEASSYHLMVLNKRIAVNSLEKLLRLGKITASVQDLSQCDNAEEAQRWMYKLPNIYQCRLEQEHLTKVGFNIMVNLTEGVAMVQTKMIDSDSMTKDIASKDTTSCQTSDGSDHSQSSHYQSVMYRYTSTSRSAKNPLYVEHYQTEQVNNAKQWGKILLSPDRGYA